MPISVTKKTDKIANEADKELKKIDRNILQPAYQASKDGTEFVYRGAVLPAKATSEAGKAILGKKSWGEAQGNRI